MTPLSSLTVDELADGICLRAGRIAAGQAELLAWIAEFDRREGWGGPGLLSCAHWLSWRIGLSSGAAREQVRVARPLEELPDVASAFGDGRLSYSKVRAISRVAEPDDGADWVSLARHSSAAQLEKVVRGVRRAQAPELVLHPDRRLSVATADGVPVVHHPAQPWADPADLASGRGRRLSAGTLPPDGDDARMDLGYVVSVVLAQAA